MQAVDILTLFCLTETDSEVYEILKIHLAKPFCVLTK